MGLIALVLGVLILASIGWDIKKRRARHENRHERMAALKEKAIQELREKSEK